MTNTTEHTPGYPEALARRDALELAVSQCGSALKAFPRGAMGLTPDAIKSSPEFRAAKEAYNRAFAELRAFNADFVKRYAKDEAKRRASRRKAGAA